jgi:hypothetical protein
MSVFQQLTESRNQLTQEWAKLDAKQEAKKAFARQYDAKQPFDWSSFGKGCIEATEFYVRVGQTYLLDIKEDDVKSFTSHSAETRQSTFKKFVVLFDSIAQNVEPKVKTLEKRLGAAHLPLIMQMIKAMHVDLAHQVIRLTINQVVTGKDFFEGKNPMSFMVQTSKELEEKTCQKIVEKILFR